jgi:hypothetical protein
MKTTQERIEAMEQELAALKQQLVTENTKLFNYPWGETFMINDYSIESGYTGEDKDYLQHGKYRLTEYFAQKSLERNQRANLLEARVEQIQGEYGGDSYICFSRNNNEWRCLYDHGNEDICYPDRVYMQYTTASQICDELNSGKFKLNGSTL